MRYLVIPSARYAPTDLGQANRVPMALYPINNEPIIDLILEQYPKELEVVVSAYEGYELFDSRGKSKRQYKIIKIDQLKDIGYTLCNTLEKLPLKEGDSLILNFADTVIDNNDLTEDCIVCQRNQSLGKKWTYLSVRDGVIEDVIDKIDIAPDSTYSLVCGVFALSDPLALLRCLKENETSTGCNFYQALKQYSRHKKFDIIEAQNWLDIGHPEEYFESKIAIKSRVFNHMVFDKQRGVIKKTSEDRQKLIAEINWFLKLPKKLQYVTPRIYGYSLDPEDVYAEMEYYSYPTLLELFLYGNLEERSWRKIFRVMSFVLEDFGKYKVFSDDVRPSLIQMYADKTINRLMKARENSALAVFFDNPIEINGIRYKCLNKVLDLIPEIVNRYLLGVKDFTIIHGDLCFANVLIDEKLNFLKLIDPRGSFGSFDIYGDQRYELAKIFHSVDGKYDYIIKDLFSLEVHGSSVKYHFNNFAIDVYSIAKKELKNLIGGHLQEIEIIESLLFLSMVPLHEESEQHQIMMIATGLTILDRWVSIKEE